MAQAKVILVSDPNSTPWSKTDNLKKKGVRLIQCDGGFDALDELVSQGADGVICTSWLPDVNGYQLCSYLKTTDMTMAMPVVLVTSDDDEASEFWKQAAMPDEIIDVEKLMEDDDAISDLVDRVLELSKKMGWAADSVRKTSLSELSFSSRRALESHADFLDLLLTDRLTAGVIRTLTGAAESQDHFIQTYFRVLGALTKCDAIGVFVYDETEPWGAVQVDNTVSATTIHKFKKDSVDMLGSSQAVNVHVIGEPRSKGGKALRQTEIMEIEDSDEVLGVISFASCSKKGFDDQARRFFSRLQKEMRVVIKFLMLAQQYRRLVNQPAVNPYVDSLTGLYNLEFLIGFLQQQLMFSYRQRLPVGLAIIDIDGLSKINEEHGTSIGDFVISAVANRLANSTRSSDLLARYSGDEFALVLPNTDPKGAEIVADKIRKDIESQSFVYHPDKKGPIVSVTVGCATFNMEDLNPETILLEAKLAMQRAKKDGSGKVAS